MPQPPADLCGAAWHFAPRFVGWKFDRFWRGCSPQANEFDWKEVFATTRAVGGMQRPQAALGLLVFVAMVLLTFDAYGGVTRISALCFGSEGRLANRNAVCSPRSGSPVTAQLRCIFGMHVLLPSLDASLDCTADFWRCFMAQFTEMNENIKYEVAFRSVLKSIDPALVNDVPAPVRNRPRKAPCGRL